MIKKTSIASGFMIAAYLIGHTSVGAQGGDHATQMIFGKITLLARRDVGLGRRVTIQVRHPQPKPGARKRIMEFSVDDDARIEGPRGPVVFSKLTLGLLIRVDYIEDMEAHPIAKAIYVQPSEKEGRPGGARSLGGFGMVSSQ